MRDPWEWLLSSSFCHCFWYCFVFHEYKVALISPFVTSASTASSTAYPERDTPRNTYPRFVTNAHTRWSNKMRSDHIAKIGCVQKLLQNLCVGVSQAAGSGKETHGRHGKKTWASARPIRRTTMDAARRTGASSRGFFGVSIKFVHFLFFFVAFFLSIILSANKIPRP